MRALTKSFYQLLTFLTQLVDIKAIKSVCYEWTTEFSTWIGAGQAKNIYIHYWCCLAVCDSTLCVCASGAIPKNTFILSRRVCLCYACMPPCHSIGAAVVLLYS